jgi:hypothetical protein
VSAVFIAAFDDEAPRTVQAVVADENWVIVLLVTFLLELP